MQNKSTIAVQQLQQIADILLLQGSLTDPPGLIYGKLGIAVFFFHYARYTGNELFEDYALDLIEYMQEQIHSNSKTNYRQGLAGIGAGIDYLIQNRFLNASKDFFDDFDHRMYCAVMYDPWQDFSLYEGLAGYGRYWIARSRYQASPALVRNCLLRITERIEENLSNIHENEQIDVYCFLLDLQKIPDFEKYAILLDKPSADFSRLGDSTVGNIVRMYQRSRYFNISLQDEIDFSLKQIPDLDMEKPPTDMGLLSGYSGEGMLRLTTINQSNISWMFLL